MTIDPFVGVYFVGFVAVGVVATLAIGLADNDRTIWQRVVAGVIASIAWPWTLYFVIDWVVKNGNETKADDDGR